MGNGIRIGNRLKFQITANYNMNSNDLLRWKRAFLKASEILYNATEGQLSFESIFVNNDNIGINNAEFVLDPDVIGRALGTSGKFGTIGEAIQLPAYAQTQVLSIIHELGHHLWALGEEYARSDWGEIDKMVTLSSGHGNRIIPLVVADLKLDDAEYSGADALLSFEDNVETRTIDNKSGDRITVTTAFPQNPQDTEWSNVTIQWTDDVECTGDKSTGACIMEFSRSNAGIMQDDGTWVPATNPVTEFCTADNHDPDQDTNQHDIYAASCWDTIIDHPKYSDLSAPATTASKDAPNGYTAPNWVELTDDFRFALVLDRSGSMNKNGGARLEGTKSGAAYWLENAAVEDDHLSIIWFNTNIDTPLSLTDFSTLSDGEVSNLVNDIYGQNASGGTNIRHGLLEALDEMLSPGELGALQASLLLTDGAHNTPRGSSMQEVVPDYQDNNSNIYTLGIGTGAEMDLEGLEKLTDDTGGSSFNVGDGTNTLSVQNSMIEINNLIRGGLLTSGPDTLPDMKEGDTFSKLKLDPEIPLKKRPALKELFKKLNIKPENDLMKNKNLASGRLSVFEIDVEKGAEAITLTLSFEDHEKLWMYIEDPSGKEITASSSEIIAFISTGQPYEFAKINKPTPGKWKIIAFRPVNGTAIKAKVIAGIKHSKLTVYATAKANRCGINIIAGARYAEKLTGIFVNAILKNKIGRHYNIPLKDFDETGYYNATPSLPNGHYEGYVELRSPGNTMIANYQHVILHTEEKSKESPNLIVEHPPFLRHVPISFYVGPKKEPKVDKSEMKEISKERNKRNKSKIKSKETNK